MTKIYKIIPLTESAFLQCQKALVPVLVPLEQSPSWGQFNDKLGGRQFLGSFRYDDENGKLVALASAILYKERGRNWIWIKHGPVFAATPNTEVIKKMCATLQHQFGSMAQINPVFVRVSLPQKVKPLVLPFEHTMYDETVIAQLDKSEAELFAGMSQSGRQGVRKAAKHNVVVAEISENPAKYFERYCYPILKETGERDRFGIHPLAVYTTMLSDLKESALYVATVEDTVEAWAITTEYNTVAMYYYGGSSAKARETSAAYALHWEVMKIMKAHGNKTYDFMGIAGKHFQALKNVTQFKIKFSKNIVKVPVTYDLPLQAVKYRALSLAIKAKRKLKRS